MLLTTLKKYILLFKILLYIVFLYYIWFFKYFKLAIELYKYPILQW